MDVSVKIDSSLNRIFNALSIGVQYTLLFQWINFDWKSLLKQDDILWVDLKIFSNFPDGEWSLNRLLIFVFNRDNCVPK